LGLHADDFSGFFCATKFEEYNDIMGTYNSSLFYFS